MNIMRKLRGGVANASSASSSDLSDTAPSSPHTQLGLMHLKKLFSEYTHPPHQLTDRERDDKLYNMLPLFCKVNILKPFQNYPTCFVLQIEFLNICNV